jgi:NTP pyrophosphatase (non-canonical NTP hydrolase)
VGEEMSIDDRIKARLRAAGLKVPVSEDGDPLLTQLTERIPPLSGIDEVLSAPLIDNVMVVGEFTDEQFADISGRGYAPLVNTAGALMTQQEMDEVLEVFEAERGQEEEPTDRIEQYFKYNGYQGFVEENWSNRRSDENVMCVMCGDAELYYEELRSKYIMATGLAGETGEVLELLKKEVRDGKLDKDKLALELGDVLHYLVKIMGEYGFTMEEVQRRNMAKLIRRREHGKDHVAELEKIHYGSAQERHSEERPSNQAD